MIDLVVTDQMISLFAKEPTALIVWQDIILQTNRNNSFIPRREYIKNKFSLGEKKFRRTIKFLKGIGLAETYPIYYRGKMAGAQYKFYRLENAVKTPSPATTPGAQSKTKAIALIRDIQKPKALSNVAPSEWYEKEYSEHEQGQKTYSFSRLIRFESNDPEQHKKIYLEHFSGQNTFQVFDDAKRKRRELSKIYHTYNQLNLDAKNDKGAGIFLTINETDGKGRSKENIIKVRAVFADLDGAPLDPVLKYHPSIVVESSPGRFHAYWLTNDVPLDNFTMIQKAIVDKFGSDPKVSDLPHVMRVPGYYHCKEEPVLCRILYTSENKYSFDELKKMFPEIPKKRRQFNNQNKSFQIHGANDGERNDSLCKIIGAMKKRKYPEERIKKQAHEFGTECVPPLRKTQVETTLRSAEKWE